MQVSMTLKRVFEKGKLCFELPSETELICALRDLLITCHEKNNDFVNLTLKRPYKPRSTGKGSQNHHLNGHIVQLCRATGNDYETIKYCIKMIAVEQMGFPFTTVAGHILPKRESDCDTAECAKLIEASHYLAAQMGIVLQEVSDDE